MCRYAWKPAETTFAHSREWWGQGSMVQSRFVDQSKIHRSNEESKISLLQTPADLLGPKAGSGMGMKSRMKPDRKL